MIVKNTKVEINTIKVLYRLGHKRNQEIDIGLLKRIKNLIEKTKTFISPVYTYSDLNIRVHRNYIELEDGTVLKSKSIAKLMKNSIKATVFFATIGAKIDTKIEKRFQKNKELDGMIIDAIGSEYVEALAEIVNKNVLARARRKCFKITRRFSPGYGDLRLSSHRIFAKICNSYKIGIKVMRNNTMIPRKTISAIIGWEKL